MVGVEGLLEVYCWARYNEIMNFSNFSISGGLGPNYLTRGSKIPRCVFYHNSVKNNAMVVVEGLLEAYCWARYNEIKIFQIFLFQGGRDQITIFGQ